MKCENEDNGIGRCIAPRMCPKCMRSYISNHQTTTSNNTTLLKPMLNWRVVPKEEIERNRIKAYKYVA